MTVWVLFVMFFSGTVFQPPEFYVLDTKLSCQYAAARMHGVANKEKISVVTSCNSAISI